ncbi:unnamed protein product, partial [Cuscuta epithymum]
MSFWIVWKMLSIVENVVRVPRFSDRGFRSQRRSSPLNTMMRRTAAVSRRMDRRSLEMRQGDGRRFKQQIFMESFGDMSDGEVVASERRARPPLEPPPWSASKSRVLKKIYFIGFVCSFSDCYVCLAICFLFIVPVCKTLVLDVGDEGNLVTELGLLFPDYGSAYYIATTINSEYGLRDD